MHIPSSVLHSHSKQLLFKQREIHKEYHISKRALKVDPKKVQDDFNNNHHNNDLIFFRMLHCVKVNKFFVCTGQICRSKWKRRRCFSQQNTWNEPSCLHRDFVIKLKHNMNQSRQWAWTKRSYGCLQCVDKGGLLQRVTPKSWVFFQMLFKTNFLLLFFIPNQPEAFLFLFQLIYTSDRCFQMKKDSLRPSKQLIKSFNGL